MKQKPKAPPEPVVSPALRAWTRGTSFTLAMGKTQVAVLISLHHAQDWQARKIPMDRSFYAGWRHPLMKNFVTAGNGLIQRGLVAHHGDVPDKERGPLTRHIWEVTPAGQCVVDLLKMSGVYQEVLADLLEADEREARRRVWLA